MDEFVYSYHPYKTYAKTFFRHSFFTFTDIEFFLLRIAWTHLQFSTFLHNVQGKKVSKNVDETYANSTILIHI